MNKLREQDTLKLNLRRTLDRGVDISLPAVRHSRFLSSFLMGSLFLINGDAEPVILEKCEFGVFGRTNISESRVGVQMRVPITPSAIRLLMRGNPNLVGEVSVFDDYAELTTPIEHSYYDLGVFLEGYAPETLSPARAALSDFAYELKPVLLAHL